MSVQEKFSAIRKGLLEFLILRIVASDKVYVADMLERLSDTEFATQEGTLYPLLSKMRREGLVDSAVPRVTKALEEITEMNFTPNEGFMLSRINGQWDIGSLIKISPIREPDAMLIFYRLWKDGIIALDAAR